MDGLKTIVNISSLLGSIQNTFNNENCLGDKASYRISKAANNMVTRTFAAELNKDCFTVVAMHPGHVNTDMGSAGGRKAPLEVIDSV